MCNTIGKGSDDMKEKTLAQKYLYNGKIVKLREDKAVTSEGCEVERTVVEHPGGVGIALEDEDGRFFFVTQWRYAQGKTTLEYPAGKREKGEEKEEKPKAERQEES